MNNKENFQLYFKSITKKVKPQWLMEWIFPVFLYGLLALIAVIFLYQPKSEEKNMPVMTVQFNPARDGAKIREITQMHLFGQKKNPIFQSKSQDFKLVGIIHQGQGGSAIIAVGGKEQLFSEGDTITPGNRIEEIENDSVTINSPRGRETLELYQRE